MLILMMMTSLLGLSSCDIHEYPKVPETAPYEIQLDFNVENMFDWENTLEIMYPDSTKSYTPSGEIRYTIRLYPVSSRGAVSQEYTQEHIIYSPLSDMYGETFTLQLKPGEYELMIWADLEVPGTDGEYYYDPSNFSEVLLARHQGNTDYRDAFRGRTSVTVLSDMYERERETIVVKMERPIAKYEVVTNDLGEFINKLIAEGWAEKCGIEVTENMEPDGTLTKSIDLDQFTVKFYYVGFMPSAYSLFTDKPVDSQTGVLFESKISGLNEDEASLGFDYVFVNGTDTFVTVQIGVYDNEGTQLSLTEPIDIALKRNQYTILKGSFLMQKASGGVSINPDYDGDYNIPI